MDAAVAAKATAETKLTLVTTPNGKADHESKHLFIDAGRFPAFQALLIKEQQRNTRKEYDGVLNSAGLPAAKLAQVKKLLLDQAATEQDAIQAAAKVGIDPNSPAMTEALSLSVAEIGDEINGILGEASYDQLTKAMRIGDTTQQLAKNVGLDMADAGAPLSPEQTSALAQIEADYATGPQMTNGDSRSAQIAAMMKEPPDPQTGLRPMDQAQLDRATQVLSPQQLQILQQNMVDQNRISVLYQNAANQYDAQQQPAGGT